MPLRDIDTTQGGAAWAAEVVRAAVNVNQVGSNVVIAGVAGKYLVLLSYVLVGAGANTITIEDSDGYVKGGPMSFAANGGAAPPECRAGHAEFAVGKGLCIGLTAATQVGGHVTCLRI